MHNLLKKTVWLSPNLVIDKKSKVDWMAEQIISDIRDDSKFWVKIKYKFQNELNGTASGIKNFEEDLGIGHSFL